jgi:hypothetical protein
MNVVWMGLLAITSLWVPICSFSQPSHSHFGKTEPYGQPSPSFQFEIANEHGDYRIRLEPVEDVGYRLLVTKTGDPKATSRALLLPWSVYHCEVGDVDGNGRADIFVGVTKRCDYDPKLARRLFVYEIIDGIPQPKWLGTVLSDELLEFTIVQRDGQTVVRTREQDTAGRNFAGEYQWEGFGFVRVDYRDGHSFGGNDGENKTVD